MSPPWVIGLKVLWPYSICTRAKPLNKPIGTRRISRKKKSRFIFAYIRNQHVPSLNNQLSEILD